MIVGYRESLASELKDLQSGKCAGQSDEADACAGDPEIGRDGQVIQHPVEDVDSSEVAQGIRDLSEMKCGQSVGVSQHCRTTIVASKYPRSVQPVFLQRFSPNRFVASLIGW